MESFKKVALFVLFVLLGHNGMAQQETVILRFIQNQSDIKEGGSNIFVYKDVNYIVSVAALTVGTKDELSCKKVGAAKAKKEMLSFINGSDITSYTELSTSETNVETLEGRRIEARQEYVEYIREEVIGTINQIVPLGGWYSDDNSVYYYAICKTIE